MIDVHVSVIGNTVILLLPPVSLHDLIPPPPAPPVKAPAPAVEVPVPVMWPPGFALLQNKLTTTVLHKFQFIMLEGHDCGYMIPHVSIPPANLLTPVMIMFSSRKAMFSASKIKANGTAVGCSQLLLFPLPMMTCGAPVSMPSSFPPVNVMNNVTVGMELGDLLAGIAAIVFSLLADLVCSLAGNTPLFKSIIPGNYLPGFVGADSIGGFLVKTGAGVLTGAAKILLTGEGTIQVAIGSSYLGGNVSYTRTAEGANQFAFQRQVLNSQTTDQVSYNADGTSSEKTTEVTGTPFTQSTHETETTFDKSGKPTQTSESDVTSGGAPLIVSPVPTESAVAGTKQSKTVTKPGEKPEKTSSSFGGVGTPFGGKQLWGDPL